MGKRRRVKVGRTGKASVDKGGGSRVGRRGNVSVEKGGGSRVGKRGSVKG